MIRLTSVLVGLMALGSCSSPRPGDSAAETASSEAATGRPNVVVIVVDDLRWDELGVAGHPFLETPNIDRLARQGALFTNAFNTVPLCSPNRATILTGQYPSRHGIIDNVARNRQSHRLETFPRALQANGYETAFLGKWHMGNDPTPRPGFDYWVAIPGQGRTIDPDLYEDGGLHTVEGYITDVLTDRAVAFIERERDRPFFLYVGHKAIHPDARQLDDGSVDLSVPSQYIPAPRHRGRYEDKVLPPRPNVAPDPGEGKPVLRRALARKRSPELVDAFGAELESESGNEAVRRRSEMLLAVDESVGRIAEALDRRGILDDTFILFTSDNGFFYGEHGLTLERRLPYEESIRAPLIIRYPALAEAGARIDGLAASVDIAPTVLDATATRIGDDVQGRSLVPLLRGRTEGWRTAVLVEFYTYENPFPWLVDMDYRAVRTDRYKYVHWMQYPGEPELYDLQDDPYEMRNLAADQAMAGVVEDMRARLRAEVVAAMGIK